MLDVEDRETAELFDDLFLGQGDLGDDSFDWLELVNLLRGFYAKKTQDDSERF